jgi:anti-sigma factor RsiW
MTAHLNDEQIRAYRERSLVAAELLDVSEHVGGCEACQARIASPAELEAGVHTVRFALNAEAGSSHLSYDEIAAYADQKMAAAERVALEAHAADCRSCADDLYEIRMLRSELEAPRAVARPSSWAAFWRAVQGWKGALALAGAVCALLLFVLLRAPIQQNTKLAQGGLPDASTSSNPVPPPPTGSVIRDGTRVLSVTTGGTIAGLGALPAPYRMFLEQAMAQKRIEPAASLADLAPNGGVLLGASTPPMPGKLLAPLATVVESQRPVFRWQPIAGAVYRISVYGDGYEMVASSDWISGTEWQITKPLRRGMLYSWQLNVRPSGSAEFTIPTPPAAEARFRILGEAEAAEIGLARSDWSDSHLVLGVLYARAGLLDEAERELGVLRQQNPASEDVASLQASVARLRVGASKR